MDTWPTGLNSFSSCQHVFFPKITQISNINFAVCKVWTVKDERQSREGKKFQSSRPFCWQNSTNYNSFFTATSDCFPQLCKAVGVPSWPRRYISKQYLTAEGFIMQKQILEILTETNNPAFSLSTTAIWTSHLPFSVYKEPGKSLNAVWEILWRYQLE